MNAPQLQPDVVLRCKDGCCEGCRWFRLHDSFYEHGGWCHRFPPQATLKPMYPHVDLSDFCGEWEPSPDYYVVPQDGSEPV